MQVGMRDVDAVIFDFDGTLADSMWVWDEVDRVFLAKRGIPFTDEFGEMIAVLGFELGADFAIEHFGLDESPESIIEEWKSLAEESYATHVMLKPGAFEYLRHCKEQGMPLAIATSPNRRSRTTACSISSMPSAYATSCNAAASRIRAYTSKRRAGSVFPPNDAPSLRMSPRQLDRPRRPAPTSSVSTMNTNNRQQMSSRRLSTISSWTMPICST